MKQRLFYYYGSKNWTVVQPFIQASLANAKVARDSLARQNGF